MTEHDLNDLDSLLTLLAGAPLERLESMNMTALAYLHEARSEEGRAAYCAREARHCLDQRAVALRNMGQVDNAARAFLAELHTVEGVRAALLIDLDASSRAKLVELYATLTRAAHEEAAFALDNLNKSLKKNAEASS